MRVLKRGVLPKQKSGQEVVVGKVKKEKKYWWVGTRITCKKCGCCFEVEKRDRSLIIIEPCLDLNGKPIGKLERVLVHCPTCKNTIVFTQPTAILFAAH